VALVGLVIAGVFVRDRVLVDEVVDHEQRERRGAKHRRNDNRLPDPHAGTRARLR